jgi:hypothetical protein
MNVICNSDLRVILLSNPGTGKSVFQFYMLARFLNPALFAGDGGHEQKTSVVRKFGSATPPRVVVRQVLGSSIQVWFLEEQVVHIIIGKPIEAVLRCFDPVTTLYFFEPGSTNNVEPVADIHELPTLLTTTPNIDRYKEFCKEATTMYCPVYTKEELLAIGRDIRQPARGLRSKLGDLYGSKFGDLYSDDNISQRFDLYGGMFYFVLPAATVRVNQNLTRRKAFFQKTDFTKMVNVPSSELVLGDAGTFALLYDVGRRDDGTWDFLEHSFKYTGVEVERKVREVYTNMDFDKLLKAVRDADELDARGY